ncbi:MAG: peptidylprolyl isomerase [Chloroflexia bacterium]|nr:peptidylprolyl isomerase [Chloroflexia bacterium]
MKKGHLVYSILLLGVLLVSNCSARVTQEATPEPAEAVAIVNGIELTSQDLEREMRHTRAFYLHQYGVDLDEMDPENPDDAATLEQIQTEALDRVIDQELIRQVAEGSFPASQDGQPVVSIDDQEVQSRAEQYEAQAENRESLLLQNGFETYEEFLQFVRGELRVEKLYQLYGQAEQVHARHILVETEEQAQQALSRLEKGEDFAKVAQEVSQDPGSASQGGDLGWFGRGTMVAPFEETCFSLEIGEISPPVETKFGFHLIQVLEKENRPDPAAFQQWFEQIKAQAQIEKIERPAQEEK